MILFLIACNAPCESGHERLDDGNCYPETTEPQDVLGGEDDETTLVLVEVAGAAQGLFTPRDLEFHPDNPDQVWVVNYDNAMVVIDAASSDSPSAQRFSGSEAEHWLARPSALAFGAPGYLATSHESLGDGPEPERAMGPTLWPSDLEAFDGGRPSHLDMVHDAALSMGIAWEQDNEYWVHDGNLGCLTWYDFAEPHEPGGTDHKDAKVVRYLQGTYGYEPGIPSHLAFDTDYPNVLYFADTANNWISALNITSGGDLEWLGESPPPPHGDATEGKWAVDDAEVWVVADGLEIGMEKPSGLEVHDGLLWITDNATSTIWALTPEGEVADFYTFEELPPGSLAGIAFDPDGGLWLVDMAGDRVLRVEEE